MTASARWRPPKRVPILRSRAAISPSRDGDSHLCGGQQPFFCSEEHQGEEAATPGQPVALSAFLEVSPRQFPLENRRIPPALPQSSGLARNSHVSLHTLSVTSPRPASQKAPPIVQKLWTIELPCGSSRKSKKELRSGVMGQESFQ